MNQDLSSSEDGQEFEKKLNQKKVRRRTQSNSSGYSHSSDDQLMKKHPVPRRSDSQDQLHKVSKGITGENKKSNRSMSFGNSEASVQLSTSDKEIGSD